MDTNLSSSTSQEALLNQMETMGVQSTTSIRTTLGRDTPIPRDNLSNETLDLLEKAISLRTQKNSTKFSQRNP